LKTLGIGKEDVILIYVTQTQRGPIYSEGLLFHDIKDFTPTNKSMALLRCSPGVHTSYCAKCNVQIFVERD
jgi:hypothetical protein